MPKTQKILVLGANFQRERAAPFFFIPTVPTLPPCKVKQPDSPFHPFVPPFLLYFTKPKKNTVDSGPPRGFSTRARRRPPSIYDQPQETILAKRKQPDSPPSLSSGTINFFCIRGAVGFIDFLIFRFSEFFF
jgi:hypothetical protein